jgi:hypothetical protein
MLLWTHWRNIRPNRCEVKGDRYSLWRMPEDWTMSFDDFSGGEMRVNDHRRNIMDRMDRAYRESVWPAHSDRSSGSIPRDRDWKFLNGARMSESPMSVTYLFMTGMK